MGGILVAIDGPAGSGKSSVARAVAARLGVVNLNTGAAYRAAALLALRENVDLADGEGLAALARRVELDPRLEVAALAGEQDHADVDALAALDARHDADDGVAIPRGG